MNIAFIIKDVTEDNWEKVQKFLFSKGYSYRGDYKLHKYGTHKKIVTAEMTESKKVITFMSLDVYNKCFKEMDILTISAKTGELSLFQNLLEDKDIKLLN